MTLPGEPPRIEVGVRQLHDQLSRYLRHVDAGGEVMVTMRGRHIARLTGVEDADPMEDLRVRGLIRDPQRMRRTETGRSRLTGDVSDLVGEQRR